LFDEAFNIRWRKMHLLALGHEALLDGLALLKLRAERLGEPWFWEAGLTVMLGSSFDLDARAERLRRELGLSP
jgi:hypothetical protein